MKKLLFISLLTTALCGASSAATILSEGFEGTFPPSGWTQNSVDQSNTWVHTGSYSAKLGAAGDYLITPPLTNAQTLVYWTYTTSSDPDIIVETSTSASGPWTAVSGSPFSGNTDQWNKRVITLASSEIFYAKIRKNGSGTLYIDDVSADDAPAGNSAPVLAAIGDQSVVVSNELTFSVSATDIDGDNIVLSATNLPSGAVFNTVTNSSAVTNTFTWTSAAPTGTYAVTFFANDGTTNVSETVPITVIEQPDHVTFDFIGDPDLFNVLDAESGPITYTNSGISATFTASAGKMNYTAGSGGSFGIDTSVSGEDADKFDPGEWIDITFGTSVALTNVNVGSWSLALGDEATIYANGISNGIISSTGDHTFDIIVPAGQVLRIVGTGGAVTNNGWSLNSITVKTDTNAPPVINNAPVLAPIGSQSAIEGNSLNFNVSATDADNDDITLSASNLPSGAVFNTVTNAATVSNTFTWASAVAGTYTPTFTADDGTTNVSETVTITVIEQPRLLISEVADPDGSGIGGYLARFVELYNAGTNTLDLTDWTLSRQNNGGSWTDLALSGSIASGETYVVARSTNFALAYGFEPDATRTVADGNGFDAYALYFDGDHTSGTLIDIYGELNTDGNGTAWDYEDSRVRRDPAVSEPNTTWTAAEWIITPGATTNMLSPGTHGAAPEFIPAPENQNVTLGDNVSLPVTVTNGVNTNDIITLSAIVLPDGAAFPAIEGTGTVSSVLSWSPANTGTYKVTFLAEGTDDTDSESIYIHVTSAEQPELSLALPNADSITIAWPASAGSAFNVLTNSNLLDTNGWGNANLIPFLDGDSYKVTNSIGSDTSLFYKLKSQ